MVKTFPNTQRKGKLMSKSTEISKKDIPEVTEIKTAVLKGSKNISSITLGEAVARGYEPCSVCGG